MSDAMKTQYRTLASLKKIDDTIAHFQKDIEQIPEEIKKLEAKLAERKAEIDAVTGGFQAHEKKLRKAEQDLKVMEDSLKKAESKMMEVKTNEEFQAAVRENDNRKKEKAQLEELVLGMIGELEAQRAQISEIEATFKTFETGIKSEIQKLDDERQKLVNEMEGKLQGRSDTMKQLEGPASNLYQKVISRSRTAITSIDNGNCLSCHRMVRPQAYNEILGFKAFHTCSSCGRIMLHVSQVTEH